MYTPCSGLLSPALRGHLGNDQSLCLDLMSRALKFPEKESPAISRKQVVAILEEEGRDLTSGKKNKTNPKNKKHLIVLVNQPFCGKEIFSGFCLYGQTSLGFTQRVKALVRIWPDPLQAIAHLTKWRLGVPPGLLLRRVSEPRILLFLFVSSTHFSRSWFLWFLFMLNKRDYRDLETWAGDWRVLTESNPSRLGWRLPSSAFLPAPPPPPFPGPQLLSVSLERKKQERTLGGHESILLGAFPWLPWKCFLSLVSEAWPRGLAGIWGFCSFFLSPQTHISLVLFFRLQTPELGFLFLFFVFLSSSFCPTFFTFKAKLLGNG